METFKKIGNIYDKKTVGDYYETVGENMDERPETEAEKSLLNLMPQSLAGKTVLDLGCGNGLHSELFCNKNAKKVIGMDLSGDMLEQAKIRKNKKQLDQLKLVQADMDNFPIGKDKFDFIFSRFSLVHSGKMKDVIKNLADSLSREGEILIATNVVEIETPTSDIDLNDPIPLIISNGETKVSVKDFAYTEEDYFEALKAAGLKLVSHEQYPYVDELVVDPTFPNKDAIRFSYGIFKAKKRAEPSLELNQK